MALLVVNPPEGTLLNPCNHESKKNPSRDLVLLC